jgi:CheY-like chemotaxis protein
MSAQRPTILIVDDDPDLLESLAAFLDAQGYRVVRARDSQEGLRLARSEPPDLIVMDIMMRERTEGLFAVQEIRRTPALAGVPVFVLSALYEKAPEFRVPADAAWLAHDEFFAKPVDLPVFLEKVRSRVGAGEARI